MDTFCILNGKIEKKSTLNTAPPYVLNGYERETIRLRNTSPLCLANHIQNLRNRLELRNVEIPSNCNTHYISSCITRLLNVNKVYKDGICTLLVFWQEFPDVKQPEYCLLISEIHIPEFEFNTNGYRIDVQHVSNEITQYIPNSQLSFENGRAICTFDKYGHSFYTNNGDLLLFHGEEVHVCNQLQPFTEFVLKTLPPNFEICRHTALSESHIERSSEAMICNAFIGLQWINRVYLKGENSEPLVLGYTHAREIFGAMLQQFLIEMP